MAKKDLKDLTVKELEEKIIELKKEYVDKKISINNNSLKDTSILGKIRKDTARISTMLSGRKENE